MKPTIYTDFEQYSDSWWEHRRGRPSSSEFDSIITPAKGQLSKGSSSYICRLIGDIGDVEYPRKDTIATAAMRRGTAQESESRDYFELHTGKEVVQVGGILSACGRFWSSPDGLMGDDDVLELKNPMPATHVEWLLAGVLPDSHRIQCHGHMIVSQRKFCTFFSYCPGFAPLIVRIVPDDFTAKLAAALEEFWKNYVEACRKIGFSPPSEDKQ